MGSPYAVPEETAGRPTPPKGKPRFGLAAALRTVKTVATKARGRPAVEQPVRGERATRNLTIAELAAMETGVLEGIYGKIISHSERGLSPLDPLCLRSPS